MTRRGPRWMTLSVVLIVLLHAAHGANHVRVILDTSISMIRNDGPRLATLSTLLLYDLARPNLTLGDTFEVLTFDPHGTAWSGAEPPAFGGPRIAPPRRGRAAFVDTIRSIPYNAPHTYYYPVLASAVAELEAQGGSDDRRIIVLITDGQPEDRDPDLIRRRLVPRLGQKNIQLYILAFGPAADSQQQTIHQALGGAAVGDLLMDRTGDRLPEEVIEIFSRSFGYSALGPRALAGENELNLEGGQRPEQVAVVVYWRQPNAPGARLAAPEGAVVNSPEGWLNASEHGASYSLSWVLSPGAGSYSLKSAAVGASAIVLRPAAYLLEVQPQSPGEQTGAALARTQMPLRILVKPPGNVRGFRGEVELSFQTHGSRQGNDFVWNGPKAAPHGGGVVVEAGRLFDIFPVFERDPEPPRESYDGYLTAEVRKRGVLVGALAGDHAHHVTVFPYAKLEASPPAGLAAASGLTRALARRETGCARFGFSLQGALPHPARPQYSVRATLDPALAGDPRLDGAVFTLDGGPLEFERSVRPRHGEWYDGHQVDGARLLGEHEICVQVGAPKDVDPSAPVELKVRFTLIETPYDTLPAMTPFLLKALLAAPGWMERYGAGLALGLGLASGVILWWYYRYRPTTPPGLGFAAGPAGSDVAAVPLSGGSPVRRWLGLPADRPALVDDGSYTLGRFRPVDRELYLFRCAPGVTVAGADGTPLEIEDGCARLPVGRNYTARSPRGDYSIRAEYL